jgi:hypothetical protein
MITSTRTMRRATKGGTATAESPASRGVPRRALADGVVERRRAPRRRNEPAVPTGPSVPSPVEPLPQLLSPSEHYRLELRRRADRITGDLSALLAEAKAEYEAHINAPRPAGKGGRPKKKKLPADEIVLSEADAFGEEG